MKRVAGGVIAAAGAGLNGLLRATGKAQGSAEYGRRSEDLRKQSPAYPLVSDDALCMR